MFSQFFGTYLLDNQKITDEQYASCMDYIKANHVKLGLIAETEGLLTHSQADELNNLQMYSDKRFGDLAIEKGYLTDSDVSYLLSRQANPYLIFVQALEENGIFSHSEVEAAVAEFKEANGFSDSVLKAIQDGNIDDMLPAFVSTDAAQYRPLIGLALRNIIRFVSSYLRIGKGYFTSSHTAKSAAYQHTTGAYEGFLGFCSDDENSLISIASGYARENFTTVDEDVLDAVAEFTNCINGLYAAELSYQGVSIDMLPPELVFDFSLDQNEDFYVLPIYIEGKKSDLIIKIGK